MDSHRRENRGISRRQRPHPRRFSSSLPVALNAGADPQSWLKGRRWVGPWSIAGPGGVGASGAGIHCGSRSKCFARRDDVEPEQQGGFVGRDGFALGAAGERLLAFDAEGRDVTASRTPSPFGGAAARLPE
jgi:hypothetical protein